MSSIFSFHLQFRHSGGPQSGKEAGLGLVSHQIVGDRWRGAMLGGFIEGCLRVGRFNGDKGKGLPIAGDYFICH